MATSSKSMLKGLLPALGALSKAMTTPARLARGIECEPPQIKSSARLPRILFIDCSPSAKRNASAMFDFPLPLGPTIAVVEAPKSSAVFLANDLNPTTSSRFSIG